jgi:uncharacterized protein (DUF2147 family)
MKTFMLFLSLFFFIQNAPENDIIGTWNTMEENTKIQIIEQKGVITGRVKSSDNPKAQIGKLILKDLVRTGNSWSGQIFAAKKNEWYNVDITSKKNTLNLKIRVGFVSKNVIWEK